MKITDYLRDHYLILDGGMGTLLQKGGMQPGEVPVRMNLKMPDVVQSIHRSYFEAGSNVATLNTFGLDMLHFDEEEASAIITAAVRNARTAAEEAGGDQPRFIALDLGPTGRLLKPFGDLDFEEAIRAYAPVVRMGAAAGVDCVIIETMNDCYETKAAVLAVKENCDLPVFVTNAYSDNGRLLTGASPEAMSAMLEGLGVTAYGANCSLGPAQLSPILEKLLAVSSLPLVLQPNAGMPQVVDGKTVYDITPGEYADEVARMAARGVRILGGCCGTTPDYIRLLASKLKGMTPPPIENRHSSVISSGRDALSFTGDPVLIGERINPTGKKRLKQALRENDLDYILGEGIRQQERGAQVLDVNVGLPGIDEAEMLTRVMCELQPICELPLQLDTASPEAMEAALRRYNGKALINSVSGKEESMRAIFPMMKKYGGMAVALTLDENGIPADAEGRVAIAERILSEAAKYGIPKESFLFDTLTMAVSADRNAAMTTLEALSRIHDELGCLTVLGVSNVSFGLPERGMITAFFFTEAMERGLSAAIMNPDSDAMLNAWHCHRALHGYDPDFAAYLARYSAAESKAPETTVSETADLPAALKQAVAQGRREKAEALSEKLLSVMQPMALVQECIIPALDQAGRSFERGELYLPQLLMCAEAAQQAFEPVRRMMSSDTAAADDVPVILATVQGDIHDIGKNIVKLLLENYGFPVLDLGKDVAPEIILEAAKKHHVKLVGLSALMTTTVPAMAKTIELLHRELPGVRIIVGGAVLTEDYANEIHADAYSATAMDTVRYAEGLK